MKNLYMDIKKGKRAVNKKSLLYKAGWMIIIHNENNPGKKHVKANVFQPALY